MAAYFGHEGLLNTLIERTKIDRGDISQAGKDVGWDFNKPIGIRAAGVIASALCLDSVTNDNNYRRIATMLIEAAPEIGLDIAHQRIGIAVPFGEGNTEKTLHYLRRIGDHLSVADIDEMIMLLHNSNMLRYYSDTLPTSLSVAFAHS